MNCLSAGSRTYPYCIHTRQNNNRDNWVVIVFQCRISASFTQGSEEPFHVANLDCVFDRHQRWRTNLPRVKPFYAVKCNDTPAVMQVLTALDVGFDCASKVLMKYFKIFHH